MDWLKNMMFGSLGGPADPNQPDPYGGQYNKKAAMLYALGNMGQGLGYGLMTRDWKNALAVSNADADGYQNQAMKKAAAARLMEEAEVKKQERAQKEQEKQKFEAYVQTLPPEQQPLARMFPDRFGAAKVREAFPEADARGGAGGGQLGMTPIPLSDGKGGWAVGQLSPEGGVMINGQPAGPEWKYDPYGLNSAKAGGTQEGKAVGEARGDLPGAVRQAEITNTKIADLENNPNLDAALGWTSYLPDVAVNSKVIDVRAKVDELMGGAFLEARTVLKGGGQITDFESARAERAYARMERAMQASDPKVFREALADFRQAVNDGVSKLRATARTAPQPEATLNPGGSQRYKFNPATGELE